MSKNSAWPQERILEHLRESASVKEAVARQCHDQILAAARLIADTFASGGKMLLCGNGGSAADCQHLSAEFTSRLTVDFERPGLPAIALTTDTSFLTAFANDCGYDGIFARQVHALGAPGDLLVGISTSGSSRNVVLAVEAAGEKNMNSIVLTGKGGVLRDMATISVRVPSSSVQYIQEAHLAIEHILCDLTERFLFADLAPETQHAVPKIVEERIQ
ncbi:MAG: SIS domain-containing protein [Deltaproteobacteria bacterium]|nr:SIS domain-containing protein [Deltaproteobacteria bacterium]